MMLTQEPGWKLERKDSGVEVLRKDGSHFQSNNSRICFLCYVEVYEFERDEDHSSVQETEAAASPFAMLSSCVVALCVTILLPWLLLGG